jgi:tRNA threonylcarbamoyladenosine biosynthesis protein TsaB
VRVDFCVAADYNGRAVLTLGLDTTTRAGSVAVLRDEEVLIERSGAPDVPHGRRLPSDVMAALNDAGVALRDIDLYAVAAGPGAFTGLRIGIATIQGFAFAHGRMVVPVSSLDALAENVRQTHRLEPGARIGAWMDAARGEVFAALYQLVGDTGGDSAVAIVDEPSVGAPEIVLAGWYGRIGQAVAFTGDGALKYERLLRQMLAMALVQVFAPGALAATIARMAERRAREGGAVPPHAVRPLYVRRPDAELARDRRADRSPHPA